MLPVKSNSMSTLVMLVTLGLSSPVLLTKIQLANAQNQTSPAPTTIKIDNLTRMAPINQVLKSRYESQFPDTTIQIQSQSPDSTLESLQNKEADLAAISRLLTPEEKAQGLVQTPITREKIAIVIGKDNPLAQELTIDQVVKIFQGKITDWSELGGKPGSIRVIHRPLANNLQSTLQTYDLFKQATFEAGKNTVQLDKDGVETLVAQLGTDGISYALASQILNVEGIRPVSMYKTLPDDPRYPFSQPFTYVYQGTPNTATQAFLDFVASEEGEQAIAEAKTQPPLPSDPNSGNPNSSTTPKANTSSQGNSTDGTSSSTSQPTSSTVANNPTEPGTSTPGEAQDGNNGFGWLPIGLLALVVGGVAAGILAALSKKRQQPQAPPRPAPNYAEKIGSTRLQTTTTQLQESPASPAEDPTPEGTENPPFSEEENPLSSSNIAWEATTLGVSATGLAANLPHPTPAPIEDESQISERVDITSKELEAQTRIQNPKTELQDTPPSLRESETQWQDPSGIPIQDPGQTWIQEEEFPQDFDSGTTQLQDPNTTQLQDLNATQLQDPSTTQLQDPRQTWIQEEEFPQDFDSGTTQLQDPNTTQLQDLNATQLQDPSTTQLQDPRQTWIQEEEFPQDFDSGTTQLQDSDTQLQDRDIS